MIQIQSQTILGQQKTTFLIKELGQPMTPSMMRVVLVVIIMRVMLAVVVMIIVIFVVMVMPVLVSAGIIVRNSLPVHLLVCPGNETLEFSSVKPDSPAFLADINSDSVPFPFFECILIASGAQHMISFA